VTKLGRLVKDMKIKTLEEIYLYSLPIKVLKLTSQIPVFIFYGRFMDLEVNNTSERVFLIYFFKRSLV